MAEYNELQVYKIAYDLAIHTFRFTEKMQRSFKYTIGEKLNIDVVDLLLCIYHANSRKDERYSLLQSGRDRIEELRLLLRMSKDLNILTIKRFVVLNELVENISRQITGWQKTVGFQRKKTGTAPVQQSIGF